MSNLTNKQAEDLRKKVARVRATLAEAHIEMCETLYETFFNTVNDEDGKFVAVWKEWGFESWEDFVEEEVGMHKETGAAYRRVWEVFYIDLAGHWDEKHLVSITRMKTLCPYVTKRNVESWLKKAKTMSCCALNHAVRGDIGPYKTVSMSLTESEADELDAIVDVGRREWEGSRGAVLMEIMREWAKKIGRKRRSAA